MKFQNCYVVHGIIIYVIFFFITKWISIIFVVHFSTLHEQFNCLCHAVRFLQLVNNTRYEIIHFYGISPILDSEIPMCSKKPRCSGKSGQNASEYTGVSYKGDFSLLNPNGDKFPGRKNCWLYSETYVVEIGSVVGSDTDLLKTSVIV